MTAADIDIGELTEKVLRFLLFPPIYLFICQVFYLFAKFSIYCRSFGRQRIARRRKSVYQIWTDQIV